MPLEVGYWSIRGLGAPLRMICEYNGAEYTDKEYDLRRGEDGKLTNTWFAEAKPALVARNPLMNLPYIVDGDVVVTQSNACLTYLGRKFGMNGEGEAGVAKNDQVLCEAFDLRNAVVNLVYQSKEKFEAGLEAHWATATKACDKFEAWLAHHKTPYTCGATPTVADFSLWEMLDQHERMATATKAKSLLEGRPLLAAYYKLILEEPKLQAYFTGPQHKGKHINQEAIAAFY